MLHQSTYLAIGLVYISAFYRAWKHTTQCQLAARLRQLEFDQFCHLALGILYPLSAVQLA